ncbi:unnamed protein product, partial [Polarella glacialis]
MTLTDVTKSAAADWCMLVLAGWALAVYVLFSAHDLFFRRSWRKLWSKASKLLSDATSWDQNNNKNNNDGRLASKVSRLVEERYRRFARVVLRVVSPFLAFALCVLMHGKHKDWSSSK